MPESRAKIKKAVIRRVMFALLFCLITSLAYAQTPISCGQNVTGSIAVVEEKDEFSFGGTDGDKVTIRFAVTGGYLNPYVELFNPSGVRIAYSDSGVIDASLPATGTFKITLQDLYNESTGNYCLIFERLNNPCSPVISCGQNVTGTISAGERFKFYNFAASANDIVTIRCATTSGYLTPYLELYGPDGANLARAEGQIDKTLPLTGKYTILARDYYNEETGGYDLIFQKLNNPCNCVSLTFGQTISATISSFVDIDAYSFTASAGDTIKVSFVKTQNTSGAFDPYLELYDSTGGRIAYSSSGELTQVLASSGTFYLLFSDDSREGAGNYEFTAENIINITDVFLNPVSFSPTNNQTLLINYAIDKDSQVSLKIYDLENNLKRILFDSVSRSRGAHSEAWDGRADSGVIVPAGGYTISITATSGSAAGHYQSSGGFEENAVDFSEFSFTSNFRPYMNEFCEIKYKLGQNALVMIMVGQDENFQTEFALVNWEARAQGLNVEYWDGRDANGRILDYCTSDIPAVIAYWTKTLPTNTIVVTSAPSQIGLALNPHCFLPSYGDITEMEYSLPNSANVTIKIYSLTGELLKTLLDNVNKPAGAHSIIWSGLDTNSKVALSGEYTIEITAVEPAGATLIRRANISIR
jgi:flagellar hook assembly protein FlgD